MIYKAPAKINIGLNIVGIREDGYHLLDMVMQTIDVFDIIDITPRDDNQIVITCDNDKVPTDESNLVYRAARKLTDKGFDINIEKHIPMEAGMGGGSSDAATTLKAVNEICGLNKSDMELEEIAIGLGADVPFFIRGGRQRCEGIGEILTPLPEDKKFVVYVKPKVSASTKAVYNAYDAVKPQLTDQVVNVLEPVTGANYPIILVLKEKFLMHGAGLASMTGSGTAVFGLFDEESTARKCAEAMKGVLCRTF